jgi:transcriptional regulator GlxA family with amidase domain
MLQEPARCGVPALYLRIVPHRSSLQRHVESLSPTLSRTLLEALLMARNPVMEALNRFLFPQATKVRLSASNLEFLERLRTAVSEHYSDPEFTTAAAAESVEMSRMHLNRKLRELTGQSTHEFIKTMRLEAARNLLPKPLPVAFIAHSVGFRSSSHFAGAFREKFGAPPSEYRTRKTMANNSHPTNTRDPT